MHDLPDEIQAMRDQIAGLERDLRAWRLRYAQLKRDDETKFSEHPLRKEIQGLFIEWQHATGHKRSKWCKARFDIAVGLVELYGIEVARTAVLGAAYDPYCTKRRNGSTQRHDGWDLIFSAPGKLEEFANKAPKAPARVCRLCKYREGQVMLDWQETCEHDFMS